MLFAYRSGYAHPEPFTFEDFGSPSAIITSEGTSSVDTMKRLTKNGSIVRINRKPSMGLFRVSSHSRKVILILSVQLFNN